MNDDYENVEWNVHATTDVYTPLAEAQDPLTALSNSYDAKTFTQESSPLSANHYYSPPPPPSTTTPVMPTNGSAESLHDDTNSPRSYSIPTPPQNNVDENPPYHAKKMTIQVTDPQKHSEGPQGAYISYLVTTMTAVETFASSHPRPVRRRFQDFVWLHNALTLEFPACIVPPLPEKHRLEYIKGDRFGSDFVERRRVGLQWFLDRIARHPELQQSQCCRVFLESGDFRNDKHMQHVPPTTSVFESLSDTLLNAFTKIKKPDERFVEMKDTIDKLEDNLNTVERLYSRISKRQIDLQQDYHSFGMSIQGLAGLETGISQQLHGFSEAVLSYVKAMSEMSHKEDLLFLNDIHELLAYCNSAKAVLRARDQKQVDFEELSAFLHRTIQERERTLHPGRHMNGGLNISEIVTDKLNEVRGVNMQVSRREKLARLDRKVKELETEVSHSNDVSNAFSNQVLKEYEVFQRAKTDELKEGLKAYADSHVTFYEKGVSIWESVLPILESIQVDEESESNKPST
ncbi:hypothetical protein O0I10_002847 [Lichtheimia ornata]|uniref:Sorting nexin-4 n=1 Tax=Lichtheimia ornata TaxID=688661 RepID=A0AAD7XY77_9FUNG|nr:uncharacterized protein O0I10_002847 [Lichtheimia ornata]KAJ8661579.1 hypothetical protein O0I10_002847 [Lichtheimia ornata]